mmetsp:Transcript_66011/g.130904  ORF Transcript_66011/g.130904 Transcript_66011/m.130904 type:complete len:326 (-) Transcript_66011:112-1089(-)
MRSELERRCSAHVIMSARHLSRFARAKAARAASENVFCIVKPHDTHDSWASTLNPFKVQRHGPALYSLLCVPAGSSIDNAASAAEEGQTRMEGGNMLFLPTFSNTQPSHQRGSSNTQKLCHAGAPVAIYQQELSVSDSSFLTSAMLGGGVGQAIIDRNANPLQTYATVEDVITDDAGNATSVNVLVPGIYREEWGHIMRQTAIDGRSGLMENALAFAAAQAVAEAQRGQFYRANVDVSQVVAHARWRNVFLVTTLADATRDLAMLWPIPITAAELEFVHVSSGRSLGDEAKRMSIRTLFDGEVSIRVRGAPVEALDPTGCLRGFW